MLSKLLFYLVLYSPLKIVNTISLHSARSRCRNRNLAGVCLWTCVYMCIFSLWLSLENNKFSDNPIPRNCMFWDFVKFYRHEKSSSQRATNHFMHLRWSTKRPPILSKNGPLKFVDDISVHNIFESIIFPFIISVHNLRERAFVAWWSTK